MTAAMTTYEPTEVYNALWLGALMFAGDFAQGSELEEVAARFFERFPPPAKAYLVGLGWHQ